MKQRYQLSLIAGCLFVFILSGCAPKIIDRMPTIKPATRPTKRLPARAKIPGTQKPYKIQGKTYYPIPSAYGYNKVGIASWYGKKFHGRKTSNGETYNMYANTAAHKTLPMNTELMVENLANGRKIFVRVNDRGPFVKGRILDLSYTAAKKLDMLKHGTTKIRITALAEAVTEVRNNKRVEHFLPYEDLNAGEFYVQIGSFTNKANAYRLKGKLVAQGKKMAIKTYKDNDTTFYRVQVRAGRTISDANIVEKKLERYYPGAFVIAR